MKTIPMTMKQFRYIEAERLKVSPTAIASRIARGGYRLETRRPNARVVFVIKAERVIYEQVKL